ncbi:carboxypeptidase regulatory-like domain-containing protein [candidate division WOR-3 bacterium]|nr:carboxypeptidase regulatory-like domain-containing protein [candidate division WOR-3 bacterium]
MYLVIGLFLLTVSADVHLSPQEVREHMELLIEANKVPFGLKRAWSNKMDMRVEQQKREIEPTMRRMEKERISPVEYRVRQHLKEVANLQAEGRTPEEIVSYFNVSRKGIGTSAIAGSTYWAKDTSGISGVTVNAFDEYGYFAGSYYSGYNGYYMISGLHSGKYYLRTYSYTGWINEWYDNVHSWWDAALVNVADADTVWDKNFYLDCAGFVNGYFYEVDGFTPIANKSVNLYGYTDSTHYQYFYAYTDINGEYTLSDVPQGSYKFKGTVSDYKDEFYDNVSTWESATVVNVNVNDTTFGIDYSLERWPAGAISGHLHESDGTTPIFNAWVYASTFWGYEPGDYGGAYTDIDGYYVIEDLICNPYNVRTNASGYVNEYWDDAINWEDKDTVWVIENDTIPDIDFVLDFGGAIAGNVQSDAGDSLCSAYVTAYDTNSWYVNSDWTDASGNYIVGGLQAGDYILRASKSDYVPEYYDDVFNFVDATRVPVTVGDTTQPINFSLAPGAEYGYISGNVYESDGTTPISSVVEVYEASDGDFVTSTYSCPCDGYYLIELQPGNYKLYATPLGSQWWQAQSDLAPNFVPEYWDGSPNWTGATPITVTAGDTALDKDFTLELGGSIQGFITHSGKRVSSDSTTVSIFVYNATTGAFSGWAFNTFCGGYRAYGVPAGTHKVAAIMPYTNYAVKYYGGGATFDDALSDTLVVVPAGDPDANIAIDTAGGAISGYVKTVSNGDTSLLFDVEVFGYDGTGHLVQTGTGHHGDYRLGGLRTGNYALRTLDWWGNLTDEWWENVPITDGTPRYDIFYASVPGAASWVNVTDPGEVSGIDFYFDVGVEESPAPELVTLLHQNKPNPFSSATNIQYTVGKKDWVSLKVYDICGRLVRVLTNERKQSGTYTVKWDGKSDKEGRLSNGVYFYQLKVGNETRTQKMLLIH